MPENENIFDVIKEQKKTAKALRDGNEFEQAVEVIQTLIKKMETASESGSSLSKEKRNKLTFELADCYGIKGGIFRRWGLNENHNPESQKEKFRLSVEAYDEGIKFEEKSSPPNSYNLVNRLISRIFFQPEWLQSESKDSPGKSFLLEQLEEAEKEIQSQLDEDRKGDVWALADLATVRVLLSKEDPDTAFIDFVNETPPSYAYSILLDTLKPLSELNTDAKDKLIKAINYLQTQSE